MSLTHSISSLRCRLCRNGLLNEYEVYDRETDPFGVPLEPVRRAYTWGYFFAKNKRHYADVLEMAGNIASRTDHDHKLLTFDNHADVGNLVRINGVFYRVTFTGEITPDCRILDLEVDQFEPSH